VLKGFAPHKGCVFRTIPTTDSGLNRPLIPALFRPFFYGIPEQVVGIPECFSLPANKGLERRWITFYNHSFFKHLRRRRKNGKGEVIHAKD